MPTYKDSMQNKASKILRLLAQSEDDLDADENGDAGTESGMTA